MLDARIPASRSSQGHGFWPAAALLSLLASLENLLSPAYRNVVAFASSLLYGLLFCLTLRRTGNLWFAVGFHTFLAWGTILCGLGLPPLAGAHSKARSSDLSSMGRPGLPAVITDRRRAW